MGFKRYIVVVPKDDSKALIREGAELFGSTRKLANKLVFSYSHVYRWSNAESNMSLKDYSEIKAIIAKERKRKDKRA